jgi:hypothetical protein
MLQGRAKIAELEYPNSKEPKIWSKKEGDWNWRRAWQIQLHKSKQVSAWETVIFNELTDLVLAGLLVVYSVSFEISWSTAGGGRGSLCTACKISYWRCVCSIKAFSTMSERLLRRILSCSEFDPSKYVRKLAIEISSELYTYRSCAPIPARSSSRRVRSSSLIAITLFFSRSHTNRRILGLLTAPDVPINLSLIRLSSIERVPLVLDNALVIEVRDCGSALVSRSCWFMTVLISWSVIWRSVISLINTWTTSGASCAALRFFKVLAICQDLQAEHVDMRVNWLYWLFFYHGGGACPSPYTLVLRLSTDQG